MHISTIYIAYKTIFYICTFAATNSPPPCEENDGLFSVRLYVDELNVFVVEAWKKVWKTFKREILKKNWKGDNDHNIVQR